MKAYINDKLVVLSPEVAAEYTETPEKTRQLQKEALAAKRWEVETGGLILNGVLIDTSRESQAMINGAYAQAQRKKDAPGYMINFKGRDGWVSLTADQMINIGEAVGDFVQACFDHERSLSDLIDQSDTSVDINAGWPV
ncbi:DUF4376 domain-containing protein [Roseibium alexandrii]|uniref:DUF4376 domain-containing protein n=1 Tax=Roseibium alexandrii (strain DSM 17067 / NCIMB 14079 / DFL-11) TaxID=244592 RepID=A0A5E8GU46_ROSAD|nr:DUF4376 domain-containing protein [Roseibium alexandrii]EEE42850.1 hypothetical protein SADFL11_PLAS22 [Roseibium alexandrii DFL-11]